MDPEMAQEGSPCGAEADEGESPPPFGASRSRSFPVYPQRHAHGPASPQLSSGSSHHKRKYIRGRYRGVRQRGAGRWAVELKDTVTGERRWLGTFSCAEEGALAFDRAAREIRGQRAKTNFPEGAYLASSDPPVVMSDKGVVLVGSPERPRAKQQPVTGPSGTAAPGSDRVDTGAIHRSQLVPIGSGSERPASGAPSAGAKLLAAEDSKGWGIAELPESSAAEADSDCEILEGGAGVKVEAAGEAEVKAEPEAGAEAEAEPVPLLSTSWRSSPWAPRGREDGSASGPGGGFLAASSPSASTASASLPMGVQASEPAWTPRAGAPGALGFPSRAGPPPTASPRATSSSSVASTPSPALHSGWAQPEDPSSAAQPEGAPAVHRGVQPGGPLQVGVGAVGGGGGPSGANTGGRGGPVVWTPSLQEELLARSLTAALDARELWGLLTGPGFRPPGAPAPGARPPMDTTFCPVPSPSRQEAHPSPRPSPGAGRQPALIQESLERLAQAASAELLAALLQSPSATQSTAPVPPAWGLPQANGQGGHLPSLAAPPISVSAASSTAGGLEQQSTGAHTGTPMSSPASAWRDGRQMALGAPEAVPRDLPAGPRANAYRESGAGNVGNSAEGRCPEEGELSLQEVERMLMDD